ncbi:hypothetical protein H310_14817 [Aphanomyces invadans]|uniref:Uncharacterized protein n=1 Tax=Aphanomyces invadans TaxID=157072 RepID=A0A024T8Q5_9STRA|nr:hypothetical protein H310_14817 [Aphanomyces invadans]ETV90388.1 hypothetical protein H310_14817 [Aphanomyces invadans]|eukprot:XP_008880970.1 hypothetical protein H310_14817 [Aphanomyces invadans]
MDVSGQVQHLHEMINLAHGVLLEAQNLNLKQPLQSNASLFTFADMDVTPSSPSVGDVSMLDEKDDEPTTLATLTGDEIQDSFTKLAALKSAYIKHSSELLESLQQKKEDVANDNLLARRDALRKDVYERNVVLKGLIDRLRSLQVSLRILHGRDAVDAASSVAMEEI